ncbi:MAG: 16S rRNA methyltransferase, partial [Nitrososphaerales archaeon]
MPKKPKHSIIIEEASLELVPQKFWNHVSCKHVESRFGVQPSKQLLDDNFHHAMITKLPNPEKRGRPDIVHIALLDITSTPAYFDGLVQVYIHTVGNSTIRINGGVRLPRTFQRFSGVISKILSNETDEQEKRLFE